MIVVVASSAFEIDLVVSVAGLGRLAVVVAAEPFVAVAAFAVVADDATKSRQKKIVFIID